jgi:cystine transport system substrate-binding protein
MQFDWRSMKEFSIAAVVLAFAGTMSGPAMAQEKELVEQGKLHVALNGDMPGTGLKDGKLVGLDGSIMAWIAGELGLEVVPHMMDWASEIESVKSGRVDAMHGMMAWTQARAEVINITDPVYYVAPTIVQPKGQNWSSVKDLEGSTFGTITGFALIPDLKRIPGLDLKLYDTTDAAIRDLLAGRVQAIFADPPLIHWAIQQNPDWPIHIVPIKEFNPEFPVLTQRYGVVFGLNKDADNLLAAFNEKIAALWANCKNWEIAKEYGMNDPMWFQPPEDNPRAGVDRPEGWTPASLPATCSQN